MEYEFEHEFYNKQLLAGSRFGVGRRGNSTAWRVLEIVTRQGDFIYLPDTYMTKFEAIVAANNYANKLTPNHGTTHASCQNPQNS